MREQTPGRIALASRLRRDDWMRLVGQQHIIGKDKMLYRAIKADTVEFHYFYGPREPEKRHCKGHCNTTSAECLDHAIPRENKTGRMSLRRRRTIRECTAKSDMFIEFLMRSTAQQGTAGLSPSVCGDGTCLIKLVQRRNIL